jgi:hypothetical protein
VASSARSIPETVKAWTRRFVSWAQATAGRAVVRGAQDLLDPRRVLDVGGDQTAGEGLPLHVRRFGRLQALHRDVERLPHGREDEVEARDLCLAGRKEGREVEARRVRLAVGEPLAGPELEPVGGGPHRRALDPRLEAEGRVLEGGSDLIGAGDGVLEGHADRALSRDRAAREGGDHRLLGFAQLTPLPRLGRALARRRHRQKAQHGREEPKVASHG